MAVSLGLLVFLYVPSHAKRRCLREREREREREGGQSSQCYGERPLMIKEGAVSIKKLRRRMTVAFTAVEAGEAKPDESICGWR